MASFDRVRFLSEIAKSIMQTRGRSYMFTAFTNLGQNLMDPQSEINVDMLGPEQISRIQHSLIKNFQRMQSKNVDDYNVTIPVNFDPDLNMRFQRAYRSADSVEDLIRTVMNIGMVRTNQINIPHIYFDRETLQYFYAHGALEENQDRVQQWNRITSGLHDIGVMPIGVVGTVRNQQTGLNQYVYIVDRSLLQNSMNEALEDQLQKSLEIVQANSAASNERVRIEFVNGVDEMVQKQQQFFHDKNDVQFITLVNLKYHSGQQSTSFISQVQLSPHDVQEQVNLMMQAHRFVNDEFQRQIGQNMPSVMTRTLQEGLESNKPTYEQYDQFLINQQQVVARNQDVLQSNIRTMYIPQQHKDAVVQRYVQSGLIGGKNRYMVYNLEGIKEPESVQRYVYDYLTGHTSRPTLMYYVQPQSEMDRLYFMRAKPHGGTVREDMQTMLKTFVERIRSEDVSTPEGQQQIERLYRIIGGQQQNVEQMRTELIERLSAMAPEDFQRMLRSQQVLFWISPEQQQNVSNILQILASSQETRDSVNRLTKDTISNFVQQLAPRISDPQFIKQLEQQIGTATPSQIRQINTGIQSVLYRNMLYNLGDINEFVSGNQQGVSSAILRTVLQQPSQFVTFTQEELKRIGDQIKVEDIESQYRNFLQATNFKDQVTRYNLLLETIQQQYDKAQQVAQDIATQKVQLSAEARLSANMPDAFGQVNQQNIGEFIRREVSSEQDRIRQRRLEIQDTVMQRIGDINTRNINQRLDFRQMPIDIESILIDEIEITSPERVVNSVYRQMLTQLFGIDNPTQQQIDQFRALLESNNINQANVTQIGVADIIAQSRSMIQRILNDEEVVLKVGEQEYKVRGRDLLERLIAGQHDYARTGNPNRVLNVIYPYGIVTDILLQQSRRNQSVVAGTATSFNSLVTRQVAGVVTAVQPDKAGMLLVELGEQIDRKFNLEQPSRIQSAPNVVANQIASQIKYQATGRYQPWEQASYNRLSPKVPLVDVDTVLNSYIRGFFMHQPEDVQTLSNQFVKQQSYYTKYVRADSGAGKQSAGRGIRTSGSSKKLRGQVKGTTQYQRKSVQAQGVISAEGLRLKPLEQITRYDDMRYYVHSNLHRDDDKAIVLFKNVMHILRQSNVNMQGEEVAFDLMGRNNVIQTLLDYLRGKQVNARRMQDVVRFFSPVNNADRSRNRIAGILNQLISGNANISITEEMENQLRQLGIENIDELQQYLPYLFAAHFIPEISYSFSALPSKRVRGKQSQFQRAKTPSGVIKQVSRYKTTSNQQLRNKMHVYRSYSWHQAFTNLPETQTVQEFTTELTNRILQLDRDIINVQRGVRQFVNVVSEATGGKAQDFYKYMNRVSRQLGQLKFTSILNLDVVRDLERLRNVPRDEALRRIGQLFGTEVQRRLRHATNEELLQFINNTIEAINAQRAQMAIAQDIAYHRFSDADFLNLSKQTFAQIFGMPAGGTKNFQFAERAIDDEIVQRMNELMATRIGKDTPEDRLYNIQFNVYKHFRQLRDQARGIVTEEQYTELYELEFRNLVLLGMSPQQFITTYGDDINYFIANGYAQNQEQVAHMQREQMIDLQYVLERNGVPVIDIARWLSKPDQDIDTIMNSFLKNLGRYNRHLSPAERQQQLGMVQHVFNTVVNTYFGASSEEQNRTIMRALRSVIYPLLGSLRYSKKYGGEQIELVDQQLYRFIAKAERYNNVNYIVLTRVADEMQPASVQLSRYDSQLRNALADPVRQAVLASNNLFVNAVEQAGRIPVTDREIYRLTANAEQAMDTLIGSLQSVFQYVNTQTGREAIRATGVDYFEQLVTMARRERDTFESLGRFLQANQLATTETAYRQSSILFSTVINQALEMIDSQNQTQLTDRQIAEQLFDVQVQLGQTPSNILGSERQEYIINSIQALLTPSVTGSGEEVQTAVTQWVASMAETYRRINAGGEPIGAGHQVRFIVDMTRFRQQLQSIGVNNQPINFINEVFDAATNQFQDLIVTDIENARNVFLNRYGQYVYGRIKADTENLFDVWYTTQRIVLGEQVEQADNFEIALQQQVNKYLNRAFDILMQENGFDEVSRRWAEIFGVQLNESGELGQLHRLLQTLLVYERNVRFNPTEMSGIVQDIRQIIHVPDGGFRNQRQMIDELQRMLDHLENIQRVFPRAFEVINQWLMDQYNSNNVTLELLNKIQAYIHMVSLQADQDFGALTASGVENIARTFLKLQINKDDILRIINDTINANRDLSGQELLDAIMQNILLETEGRGAQRVVAQVSEGMDIYVGGNVVVQHNNETSRMVYTSNVRVKQDVLRKVGKDVTDVPEELERVVSELYEELHTDPTIQPPQDIIQQQQDIQSHAVDTVATRQPTIQPPVVDTQGTQGIGARSGTNITGVIADELIETSRYDVNTQKSQVPNVFKNFTEEFGEGLKGIGEFISEHKQPIIGITSQLAGLQLIGYYTRRQHRQNLTEFDEMIKKHRTQMLPPVIDTSYDVSQLTMIYDMQFQQFLSQQMYYDYMI